MLYVTILSKNSLFGYKPIYFYFYLIWKNLKMILSKSSVFVFIHILFKQYDVGML
jgi:hypothetical protein